MSKNKKDTSDLDKERKSKESTPGAEVHTRGGAEQGRDGEKCISHKYQRKLLRAFYS